MKHLSLSLLLLLALAFPVAAQDFAPGSVSGKPGDLVVIESHAKGNVAWMYDARDFDSKHSLQVDKKLVLTTAKPGTYSISLIAWDEKEVAQVLVVIEGTPIPPGPTPPVPPGPTPPVPPGPSPIPGQGLRVLIVYDNGIGALDKLTADQREILYSTEFRSYLRSKCAKSSDGTPEVRFFPSDTDVSKGPEVWKAAMARPRGSMPWIVIGNGSAGYEGPLPANLTETKKLLSQFGG